MKIMTRLDVVRLDNVELSVNDIVKNLAKLPISELLNFLNGPRYYSRRDYAIILRNVLKDEILKLKLAAGIAAKGIAHDFYDRLDYFIDAPVTVLENLFLKLVNNQPELVNYLKEDLWLFALQVVRGKNKEVESLLKRSANQGVKPVVVDELFAALNTLFADKVGDIDGVIMSEFSDKSLNSATLSELRQIGARFGVKLPKSITKQDILEGIIARLPRVAKAKDVEAISEDLRDMTIAELKAFVKKHKLDVAIELKKVDLGDILVAEFAKLGNAPILDDLFFVLPERVEEEASKQDSSIELLTEKIHGLEKSLTELRLEKEGAKDDSTGKRTKELLEQKEKYEAIIAEQEKERALLLMRSEEQDEVLMKYNEIKAQLAQKEAELEAEVSKRQTASIAQSEINADADKQNGLNLINDKIDRLSEKIQELQLELGRVEENRGSEEVSSAPISEINANFDFTIDESITSQENKEEDSVEKVAPKSKDKKKKMPLGLKITLWILLGLVVLTIIVFVLGFLLVEYWGAPFAGPPWLADNFNAVIKWLHQALKTIFGQK